MRKKSRIMKTNMSAGDHEQIVEDDYGIGE
jgi:hypothetical protein